METKYYVCTLNSGRKILVLRTKTDLFFWCKDHWFKDEGAVRLILDRIKFDEITLDEAENTISEINADYINSNREEGRYFVYNSDGYFARIARHKDGSFCGWDEDSKEWIELPGLIKILFETTDYDEINEDIAMLLIEDRNQR